MANADQPSWSGSGVIVHFVTLPENSKLSQQAFNKWYDEVHVSTLLATGAIRSATRWRAANPAYGKQHMTVFDVPDLAKLQAQDGQFQKLVQARNEFPDAKEADGDINYETRVMSLVELYDPKKQPDGECKQWNDGVLQASSF
jgi:hypothetical protein